jgi:hypothetical protein
MIAVTPKEGPTPDEAGLASQPRHCRQHRSSTGCGLAPKSRADFAIVQSAAALGLSWVRCWVQSMAQSMAQCVAQCVAQCMAQCMSQCMSQCMVPSVTQAIVQSESGAVSSRRLLTTQNEASPTAAPQIASMNEVM